MPLKTTATTTNPHPKQRNKQNKQTNIDRDYFISKRVLYV
jgi:hypothetical protein